MTGRAMERAAIEIVLHYYFVGGLLGSAMAGGKRVGEGCVGYGAAETYRSFPGHQKSLAQKL